MKLVSIATPLMVDKQSFVCCKVLSTGFISFLGLMIYTKLFKLKFFCVCFLHLKYMHILAIGMYIEHALNKYIDAS